jgi:cell division protease FtsH
LGSKACGRAPLLFKVYNCRYLEPTSNGQPEGYTNTAVKNVIFWVLLAVSAYLIWAVLKSTDQPISNLTFTQFTQEIAQDNVREVTVSGSDNARIFDVRGVLKKGNVRFKTAAPVNYVDWLKALDEKNVSITFDPGEHNAWMTWLANGLPMILILGLWIFIMRKMQKDGQRWRQPPATPEK